MPSVAVVILNYNGKAYLQQFVPSLIAHNSGYEIIIADNASTDDSLDFLAQNHPEIRIIRLLENHGFAGGYNHALKQVKSDYYILLNSDVEVTPSWLDPMLDFLERHQNYAACQPKILAYHNQDTFEYSGAAGGFLDALGYPYCRGRIFQDLEVDKGQYDNTIDIFWASGACMMIRAHIYHQAGGLDQDFFAHMEEIDLCWRIHSSSQKIACVPQSSVYHVGGGTLAAVSPRKTFLNFRNGLSLIIKNLPGTQLLWKLPLRLLLDQLAALKFLLDGKPKHFLAVYQAIWHFVLNRMVGDIRKRGQSPVGVSVNLRHSKSIVLDYFLKGRKKFSDLVVPK